MGKLFALILWFHDRPITGNVISLTSVKRPRKELDDYKEGDTVWANCYSYGLCEGILAKIAEEAQHKALKSVLADDGEFKALVDQFCTNFGTEDQESKEKEYSKGTSEGKKSSAEAEVHPAVVKSNKQKRKPKTVKTASSNNQVTETIDLQKAAAELELTELESAFTPVLSACTSAQEDPRLESSSILGESLQILNAPFTCTQPYMPVPLHPVPSEEIKMQEITALQGRVKYLEERLLQTEGSLECLWASHRQMLASFNLPNFPSRQPSIADPGVPAERTQARSNDTGDQRSSSHCSALYIAPGASHDQVQESERLYNGYTKNQLRSKITGIKEFSKASKLLLRTLYSEEDLKGRSLGGNKANKLYCTRPALEHPERLEVLYDLIKEQYPSVTRAGINARLGEVLKPSRLN